MIKLLIRVNTSSVLQLLIVVQVLNYKIVSPWENCTDGDEEHHRKDGQQALSGSNRSVTNCTGIQNIEGKMDTRTELTWKPKSWFESTLQYLSIKEINNEGGVQFDLRKREDAYKRTTPEENPYAVLLKIELSSNDEICSGTLLTAEWVLTASHCLYVPEDPVETVWVCAGCNSLDEVEDFLEENKTLPSTAQLIDAETFMYHPNYPDLESSFDIGLVKTSRKFEITSAVKTARLATKPWRDQGYRTCKTTGFGVVRDEQESPYDFHRKTHVLDVKKPCVCNFMVRFVSYMEGDEAAGRILCAKPNQDYGICSADSGGGLVCEEDGELVIRGINQLTMGFDDIRFCELDLFLYFMDLTSHECGDKNLVSMFQDTYFHLPWINKYVQLFSNISEEDIMKDLKHTNTAARMHSSIWTTLVNVYTVKLFFYNFISDKS